MTLALIALHEAEIGAERAAQADRAAVVGAGSDVERALQFREIFGKELGVRSETAGRKQYRRCSEIAALAVDACPESADLGLPSCRRRIEFGEKLDRLGIINAMNQRTGAYGCAQQRVQFAPAFRWGGVQARSAMPWNREPSQQLDGQTRDISEEVHSRRALRGDRSEHRRIDRTACLRMGVASKAVGIVGDTRLGLVARARSGEQAAAHHQVGGTAWVAF